jgi:hypothetical protein
MSTFLGAFSNHLADFIDDLLIIFPNDLDLKTAKKAFTTLRKLNPKAIIGIWETYSSHYTEQIRQGDISFFIENNYQKELSNTDEPEEVNEIIERLRGPIRNMDEGNKAKAMKYIQNLTKISNLYYANG